MTPIHLPLTGLTTLILGVLLLILTARVILYRRGHGVVYGDAGDKVLMKRIRGQQNAAEHIPVTLITMALAELSGAPASALWAAGALLVIGRVMHGLYFTVDGLPHRLRFWGMTLTVLAQILLLALLAVELVRG